MIGKIKLKKALFEELLYVASGAVPGALLRWMIASELQDRNIIVNTLGAGLLGFIGSLPSNHKRYLVFAIGFCGSITGFSSWILAVMADLSEGKIIQAFIFVSLTTLVGLVSAFIGYILGISIKNTIY